KVIYADHREKGWGETAYHDFISPTGDVIEGRSVKYQADSGTTYSKAPLKSPDGHICISLLGDFRTLKEQTDDRVYDVLAPLRSKNKEDVKNGKSPTYSKAALEATEAKTRKEFIP
ncbi:MAG: hypothetical protein ACK55I_44245, partial [bacterium]